MYKRTWSLAVIAVIAAFGLPAGMAAASTTGAAVIQPDYKAGCTTNPPPGQAACLVLIRTNVQPYTGVKPGLTPSGYGPAQLQSAYNLPSSTAGSGATVALVDAYDDPNAEADLAVYRSQYGLPACTTANGCFRKVNENGATSPLPSPEPPGQDWATEESLDIDMVSAACPLCHIDLVEANSPQFTHLGTAVDSAVTLGADYVSNSYGAPDFSGESALDAYYNHPGVAVTASAGDSGYGVSYPAASPDVVAVGGTALHAGSSWTESVWGRSSGGNGTGSGCSGNESKPSWQTDTGCADRTDNDVAAVADPNTGVAVYDTYDQGGWLVVGGTSASSPIIASVYALAGIPSSASYPADYVYAQHTPSNINDVTTGANGTCTPAYLCTGEVGYDGPTGWGTPNGVTAFTAPGTPPPPAPVVTGVSPTSGPAAGGTPVTVTGTALTAGTVAFGTHAATGVTCAATTCTATSPAGTGTVDVKVTTTAGTSAVTAADEYTYTAVPLPTGPITSGIAGKCVDDWLSGTANGNKIDINTCNGSGAQRWIVETNGSLKNAVNGKCIAVHNGGTANGTPVQLYTCNGTRAQVWNARGLHLVNPLSGKCLTAQASGKNGTGLVIQACGSRVNQQWTLP